MKLPAIFPLAALLALAFFVLRESQPGAAAQAGARWWKGNLHTHSLWSDGDDYPEMIVDWYKGKGYQFLAISDHNVLMQGDKWIDPAKSRGGLPAFDRYLTRFKAEWVQTRDAEGVRQVRLRPLDEFRRLFEEEGKFLLISSEEITDGYKGRPVHLNATNIRELIKPQGGDSVVEVMQNNIDAVLAQRKRTGQPMVPHVNHPNFGWAVTVEDLMQLRSERFFEVYNGHPMVHNYGDHDHIGTEKMWDILLAQRLARPGGEPMFGLAVDDSHHYHKHAVEMSNPGRGWIVARAAALTPEKIIAAMEQGDFYASTGVRLRDVNTRGGRLSVQIEPEPGVSYTTQFIGTRRGFDGSSTPAATAPGDPPPASRRYSSEIGTLLAEVKGASATYILKGDELYVRAKIISTKPQPNPYRTGDPQVAWTQPLVPAARTQK